ncbi:MAG: methyltransferase domain-containing protein [Alphaproteobacteria bacterium]|nr:methyltransferase domain-containing protein [Alphaproteobacteria bacterium]
MSGDDAAAGGHRDLVVDFYDTHPINERQILEKLAADGIALEGLSEDVLQNYDQDHYGGVEMVDVLARLAEIDATCHVLDVCSGMGGPARYLAQNYGCRVTGIDLTESRVAGATRLTRLVGLDDRVDFRSANALRNPFPDQSFDAVVSQEAFGHIPNKPTLVTECVRVAKIGGRITFTDILEGAGMTDAIRDRLGREMAFAELETLDGYRRLLEANGCTVIEAEDMSGPWTEILRERLAMYRSLEAQTTERFGAAHFRKWEDAYGFFVGLYETGELGGGRFLARRVR